MTFPRNHPVDLVITGKAALPLMRGIVQTSIPVSRGLVIAPSPGVQSAPSSEFTVATSSAFIPTDVQLTDGTRENIDNHLLLRYGDHPFPEAASFAAGETLLALVSEPSSVPILAIISGGTSAMLAVPITGLSREDKHSVHVGLVHSGRSIREINLVRRHLSTVKGGGCLRNALGSGRSVFLLALSDVPDDAFHDIGGGPFSPDPTSFAEAEAIARSIEGFPKTALHILENGCKGTYPETLKPDDPLLAKSFPPENASSEPFAKNDSAYPCFQQRLLAGSKTALKEAEKIISSNDCFPFHPLAHPLTGTPELWCRILETCAPGTLYGASGETEVAIPKGKTIGRGGRSSTLVLTAALFLSERNKTFDLADIATDGADGNSKRSGGYLSSEDLTPKRLMQARKALEQFDAAGFLDSIGRSFPGAPGEANFGDLFLVRIRR
ncbi:MAG: DUF4147 domain-containing protein [Candidatus Ozemobacteraceae bacterium]